MLIKYGDMLKVGCPAIGVTTNGFVTSKGKCVMGRGIAQAVRDKYKGIDATIGKLIQEKGNIIHKIDVGDGLIITLPVKPNYVTANNRKTNIVKHARDKYKPGDKVPGFHAIADIDIIHDTVIQLRDFRKENNIPQMVIPRLGCGAGELTWAKVFPIMDTYLSHHFEVYTFNSNDKDTLFVSGGRKVFNLREDEREVLIKAIVNDVHIIVGDCYGADQVVQAFLQSRGYMNVTVYHIGSKPRIYTSKLFNTKQIDGNKYTDKDDAMLQACTYGFLLPDEGSRGTYRNRDRLRVMNKRFYIRNPV